MLLVPLVCSCGRTTWADREERERERICGQTCSFPSRTIDRQVCSIVSQRESVLDCEKRERDHATHLSCIDKIMRERTSGSCSTTIGCSRSIDISASVYTPWMIEEYNTHLCRTCKERERDLWLNDRQRTNEIREVSFASRLSVMMHLELLTFASFLISRF